MKEMLMWWDEHVKNHGPVPPIVTINLYFLFPKESQTVKVSDQTMFLMSWVIQASHTTSKYKEGNHSRRLQLIPKPEKSSVVSCCIDGFTLAWKCPLYVIKTTGVLEFLTQSNVYYTTMWTPLKLQLKYTSMILGIDFILMKCETNTTKTSSVVDSSIVLFSALPLLVRELQTPAK